MRPRATSTPRRWPTTARSMRRPRAPAARLPTLPAGPTIRAGSAVSLRQRGLSMRTIPSLRGDCRWPDGRRWRTRVNSSIWRTPRRTRRRTQSTSSARARAGTYGRRCFRCTPFSRRPLRWRPAQSSVDATSSSWHRCARAGCAPQPAVLAMPAVPAVPAVPAMLAMPTAPTTPMSKQVDALRIRTRPILADRPVSARSICVSGECSSLP
jgi:hypothetical protein